MIRYTLKCAHGHEFESWFASSGAFDGLHAAGRLECAVCGSRSLDRALMAPRVRTSRKAALPDVAAVGSAGAQSNQPAAPLAQAQSLSAPADGGLARMLKELRTRIERDTEYVGKSFVTEARAIHAGDAPDRAIRGEADVSEARRLLEDGIAVVPLPFIDSKKTN